jgi:hypothetical protein
MAKLDKHINGGLGKTKQKPQTKKVSYATYFNWRVKQFAAELELKLPNEFKGSIDNFNHRNYDGLGWIDENEYS